MASSIKIWYQAIKQKFPNKKIIAIFQPHQINRIFTGRDDFVESFKWYDDVIIYNIYAAREDVRHFDFSKRAKNINNLTDLWNTFAKACSWIYTDKRSDIEHKINNSDSDNIIIVFSAGDIDYEIRTKLSIIKTVI